MDDIPFFDTTPYSMRGGIFADAFPAPPVAHPPEPRTAAATAAPAPDHGEPTESGAGMEDVKLVHRSHSADALVDKDDSVVDHEQGPPEPDAGVQRAETIPGGTARKRRTWFGGGKSGESDGDDEAHARGRSADAAGIQVMVTQDEAPAMPERPPLPRRRSQGSRSVSGASTSARPSSPPPAPASSPGAGLSTSAPSAPSPVAAPAAASAPASPASSSFLSALKSRGAGMAEKQPAIKEAMRKWGVGVNWAAGLRKHDNSASSNSVSAPERETEREFLEADHGDVWSGDDAGRRGASPRGSYADLRKKVERREQERLREAGESGTESIDIPGVEQEADAASLDLRRSTSRTSSIRLSPTRGGHAPFLSPSAPKTTTGLQTAARTPTATRSGSPPPPERRVGEKGVAPTIALNDPPVPAPPVPIRAQPPKAATMTIPGIHARHKGEVMGFGSAPPLQPSSSSTVDAGSSSSAAAPDAPHGTAGKTMQSVYRLFRGGAGGEAGDGASEARAEEPRSGTVAASPTSGPPPLPPRAQPTPTPTPTPLAEVRAESPASPPAFSPASQALKSVAEQDAAARQPPSLPRRRTSQSSAPSRRAAGPGDAASIVAEPAAAAQWEWEAVSTAAPAGSGWRPPLPPRRGSTRLPETAVP